MIFDVGNVFQSFSLYYLCRRLRDRFIEAERLTLAMEVSTKCGLDPSGVWGAAAFSLLQAGDFPGAREKFSRCMKVKERPIYIDAISLKRTDVIWRFLLTCIQTFHCQSE